MIGRWTHCVMCGRKLQYTDDPFCGPLCEEEAIYRDDLERDYQGWLETLPEATQAA